ncbi:NDP-hexose 2,3-dehydratase family protein [Dactylosporangium sp. CA-092794]|uniref:NDP-hexose 2,3-dehydratase family protein n=1 Tax=Dactylosporangium sp. CA-092794 TaxID=3239929 RepID=UPI003D927564
MANRFTRAALAGDSDVTSFDQLHDWVRQRRAAYRFEVERIRFDQLVGWHRAPSTGNLAHDTGRFFSIEGLQLRTDAHPEGGWSQPIINQPEVGVLGILAREFNGVLHLLMQAKMEPGNVNVVQLSPTVQATRSNYTGAHRGQAVQYLEYFIGPRRGRVLADVLQSEQGSWFLRKRNRNMVVEVTGDVPVGGDFCWLSLGQVQRLLREDNMVNMDARTVLSCLPFTAVDTDGDGFRGALQRSIAGWPYERHTLVELISWLTDVRARRDFAQTPIPLNAVEHWVHEPDVIRHQDDRYFTVIAVDVRATAREVTRWTQPLFAPRSRSIIAFLVRRIRGVLHVLVHARVEAGSASIAEFAPTVQCDPANYTGAFAGLRPPFLDVVAGAAPERIRYDVVQSEEGGRFYHAEIRNLIVEVGDDFPLDAPDDYRWMTVRQMTELLRHSNYFNVEARGLVACLHSLW